MGLGSCTVSSKFIVVKMAKSQEISKSHWSKIKSWRYKIQDPCQIDPTDELIPKTPLSGLYHFFEQDVQIFQRWEVFLWCAGQSSGCRHMLFVRNCEWELLLHYPEWCTFVFTHFLNKDRSKLVLSEEKKNRLGILFSKQNKTSGHRDK